MLRQRIAVVFDTRLVRRASNTICVNCKVWADTDAFCHGRARCLLVRYRQERE